MSDDRNSSIPPKNGNERRQDRELRDLRTDVKDNRVTNDKEHADLAKSAEANYHRIAGKLDSVIAVVSLLQGDTTGGKWVARAIRGVVVLFLTGLGLLLLRSDTRIDAVEIRQTGDASKGFQLAEDLRRDVDHNHDHVRALEKLHYGPNKEPIIGPRDK